MNNTTQAQRINKRQDKIFDESKELKEKALLKLWEDLGDIPINNNDEINKPFLHFEEGTAREDVWHWFDDTYNKIGTGKNWFDLITKKREPKKYKIRCNNCMKHFENENELELLKDNESDPEPYKGCPNCKTDGHLTDIL